MDIKPGSPIYEVLWKIDSLWLHLNGFCPDFEQLDYVDTERPLFTKKGLIKWLPSVIPLRDLKLKKIATEFGGWDEITSPTFIPTEELYSKLEAIGYDRQQFDHSRRYIADPDAYRRQAVEAKWGKKES